MLKEEKSKTGKASRAAGKRFEILVRHDLENKGWIVCKWQNNIEFTGNLGKLIPAKHTFNYFTKAMSAGNGFPDFVCFKTTTEPYYIDNDLGQLCGVQLVESKMTGKLDKLEKEKVKWIVETLHIPVIVAFKGKKKGVIEYE